MTDTNYGPLAPYYDIMIDWETRLKKEIPFIRGLVKRKRAGGIKVLDIGCGTGKHLKALKDPGCEVYGMEPSPGLRAEAEKELPGVSIHSGGFDSLAQFNQASGPWDIIYCIGNTLSHLPQKMLPGFLTDIKNSLEDGGVFLFHILGYEKILREKPSVFSEKKVKHEGSTFTFIRKYRYDDDSILFTIEIKKDGNTISIDSETLYPLTTGDIIESFNKIGGRDLLLFGDFNRSTYRASTSSNLIAVFYK